MDSEAWRITSPGVTIESVGSVVWGGKRLGSRGLGSPAIQPSRTRAARVEAAPAPNSILRQGFRGGAWGAAVLGVGMVLLAALLVSIGVIEFELAAIAVGSVFGAAGTATIWWGLKAREDRRRALMARLQRRVLLLATEKSGTLTVTEVAASLNMSLSVAEGVLDGMDDGLRVRSEVTDQGIIVYEFPELRHHPRLESGSAG